MTDPQVLVRVQTLSRLQVVIDSLERKISSLHSQMDLKTNTESDSALILFFFDKNHSLNILRKTMVFAKMKFHIKMDHVEIYVEIYLLKDIMIKSEREH